MKTNNINVIKFLVILGLFAALISGCQQGGGTATNPAANQIAANTNTAAANANTNSSAPDANTTAGAPETSIATAPKTDNCPGPGDDEVIVFEHIFTDNGGGKCKVLTPGEYKDATEMGLENDTMSSIKVGVNVKATVCTHNNFGEPCEEFTKTDLDLMDNPTIKNDTASSIKVIAVKPEAKPEAVKALAEGIAGEWSTGSEILKFTEDKMEAKYVSSGQVYNSTPYKVVDGKTVQFNYPNGTATKATFTFEDDGKTLVWFEPTRGQTWRLKRVQAK